MPSDSQLELDNAIDADALRLEQLKLEAKVARLEAEAKALEAKLHAKKHPAKKPAPKQPEPAKPVARKEAPPPRPARSKPSTERREQAKPAKAATVPAQVATKANGSPAAKKPVQAKPAAEKPKQQPANEQPTVAEKPKPNGVSAPVVEKANGSPTATNPTQSQPAAEQPIEPPANKQPAIEPEPKPSQSIPAAAEVIPPDAASDQQEDAEGEEPLAEESGRGFFSRILSSTPSYMISAVFHLAALLVLAMIMLPLPKQVKELVVEASALDEQEEEIEEVIIDSLDEQLEMVELEEPIMAHAIEVADPGAADLGAIAQDVPTEVSTFGVAMNDTNIDSIGTLFGNEGEGMADSLEGAGGAEFFGVKASGRKFVFIVDSSLSMKNGKFEAACEELMYSVARLSKDQYFYVLFFDHDAAKMTFDGKAKPEERAVPATSANINKLGQWVRTVELELRTDPYDCVEFAMELLPDAIYILTDGKFTDRGKTVRYLKNENLFDDPIDGVRPKVVIHTVGFYQRDGEPTLIPLAKTHGGTYRFVPKPPKQ